LLIRDGRTFQLAGMIGGCCCTIQFLEDVDAFFDRIG